MAATTRIDMRCEEREKALLNRAAALRGMDTSAFIRELALNEAQRLIAEAEKIEVSAQAYEQILELLDNPPAPNKALRRAMRAHRDAGL